MKTFTFTSAKIGFLIIVALVFMSIPIYSQNNISIDFNSHYSAVDVDQVIASDSAYQEILSLSIFEDVDMTISHAASKHSDDQTIYKQCMDDGNAIMGFINPKNNHCIEIMSTTIKENGRDIERFIVRVVKKTKDAFYEITAFTDEWESIREVEEYMISGGYMQIWP